MSNLSNNANKNKNKNNDEKSSYLPSNPFKHFRPNDIKFAINKHSLKKFPGFDLI